MGVEITAAAIQANVVRAAGVGISVGHDDVGIDELRIRDIIADNYIQEPIAIDIG